MRRMVTSKQIEAINKIKVNNNDILIESLPDASYIQMTEDVINIYNEGGEGVSITSDHDTVIDSGNDLKLNAANDINISVAEKPIASFDNESGWIWNLQTENITGEDGITIDPDPNQADMYLKINNLPTSDPGVRDAIWNDNGTLKISSGNSGGINNA